jgi:phosphopantothenoylcysteine decarboxylase
MLTLGFVQYEKVKVEVIATKTSLGFYDLQQIEIAGSRVWLDEDEWTVGSLLINSPFVLLTVSA